MEKAKNVGAAQSAARVEKENECIFYTYSV